MLDAEEIARRREALRQADATNRIEGIFRNLNGCDIRGAHSRRKNRIPWSWERGLKLLTENRHENRYHTIHFPQGRAGICRLKRSTALPRSGFRCQARIRKWGQTLSNSAQPISLIASPTAAAGSTRWICRSRKG